MAKLSLCCYGRCSMFDIKEELKKLPELPGVYLMHDETDEIIYVGKAIRLKRRVSSYFRESTVKTAKIKKMVSHVKRFEYIVTDSELEALILESNLIKEHSPRYNTMLKDDKSYPFIKVTVTEDYPRILFARQRKRDRNKYFGPFTSAGAVKDTIELLRKLYQIRTCNRVLPRDTGKERPCLYHHITQCSAPCQGFVSKEEYGQSIKRCIDFLNGSDRQIQRDLEVKMTRYAEEMEFEKAIEVRELLASLKAITQKQKITRDESEDRDIIAYARQKDEAVVQVFFVRNGKMLGREHFYLHLAPEETGAGLLTSFIKQYYGGTPFIPKELLVQEPLEEEDERMITEWLAAIREGKVYIRCPKKGEKERMIELAAKNAEMVLQKDKEKIIREREKTTGAMEELRELLSLGNVRRVEAYDISNTSGLQSVGSMVVYEDGKPKRNDYRKFRIKSVQGPNDYASMKEVLTRRFEHGLEEKKELEEQGSDMELGRFTRFPDLILMDGGRGQVNIAEEVLAQVGVTIPVAGMVKDDNHRTRGLYFHNVEIPIDRSSEAFKLITRIQDEAHRFAIEYHRSLRGKNQVHSILDDIPGIGPTRRKALMKFFTTIEEIKAAEIETLTKVPSMTEDSAKKVYDFFHQND